MYEKTKDIEYIPWLAQQTGHISDDSFLQDVTPVLLQLFDLWIRIVNKTQSYSTHIEAADLQELVSRHNSVMRLRATAYDYYNRINNIMLVTNNERFTKNAETLMGDLKTYIASFD